jgi:hypothetical protein
VVVNVSPGKEPSNKQQSQEGDANKGKGAKGKGAKGKGAKGKGSPSTDPPNDLEKLNDQLTSRFPDHSAFPYAAHIGTIGMGTGIYLGDGYVLTSAHVGCYPFVTQDGKIYRPEYKSWKILKQSNGASADLGIFRIKIQDPDSPLANLAPIPLTSTHPQEDDLVILIGNGLVQNAKPVGVRSGKKLLAVLGYRIEGRRAAIGGLNTVGEVINQPIKTSEFQTDCFSTSFDRNGFEAQAADGDSGGASFVYNSQLARWEIAGCIIAVSQADGFIPFGSRTYLANLTRYAGQLPNASGELDTGLPLGLAATSVDSSSPSESLAEDVIQVNPATIDVPPMPMPMETGEESSESSDGMLM